VLITHILLLDNINIQKLIQVNIEIMSTISYYFNSKSSDWAFDSENMIDGNIDTDAHSDIPDEIEVLDGNTGIGTVLGTITKVEIRAHGFLSGGSARLDIIPVFSGSSDGDLHDSGVGFAEGWSSYTDITSDTNAPANWDWDDVKNLDCKAINIVNGGSPYVSKVEIRVTYTEIFTSKATGNWSTEGESTWNEPGHPTVLSQVVIQSGHTVTLNDVPSCNRITIDSSGVLTDVTNNVGLTCAYWIRISGTMTCGTAAINIGTGQTALVGMLDVKAGGVFNGGSGNHTIGSIDSSTATSTLSMTSGNCTVDGKSTYSIEISSSSTFAHNDGTIIITYVSSNIFIDTHPVYNLTINATGGIHIETAVNVAGSLIIPTGTLYCDKSGGASFNLTVAGTLNITGELNGVDATLDLNGNVTINGGGKFNATTGNTHIAGTFTNNGTFTHNNGTLIMDGSAQSLVGTMFFYSFTKSVTVTDKLTFDNTATYTFGGNVTLNGTSGNLLSLASNSTGNAFDFVMSAGAVKTNLDYLNVKDSDASSSDASQKPIAPTNSTDVSGNTDWFGAAPTPSTTGKGGFRAKRIIIMSI